jgi:hypothetical protein
MKLEHWKILQYTPNIKSEHSLQIIKKSKPSKARLALINSIIEKAPAPFTTFSGAYSNRSSLSMLFSVCNSKKLQGFMFNIELIFRLKEDGVWLMGLGKTEFLENPTAEDIAEQMKIMIDGQ